MTETAPKTLTAAELLDRAIAATDAGRLEESERLLRLALRAPGGGVAAATTLGVVLEYEGRYDEARGLFRAAMALAPEEPRLGFPLALNLLRAGDYAAGWPLYESREIRMSPGTVGKPSLSFPEWDGRPVSSLLILPEQGLGDEMMFARYVRELKASGVAVTLLCRPQVARLFEALGVTLLPLGPSVDIPRCDAWAMIGSLPMRFQTIPGTVPQPVYLPGGAGGTGIGVMAAGREDPDPRRALPPELAAELLALPGAVSLDPTASGAKDFEDTRRIIEGLELVITVDTSVAHLAGAMGKACWTLVPFTPDWRWGLGARSPWYPAMRLFRQPKPYDWTSVVAEVKAALAARG